MSSTCKVIPNRNYCRTCSIKGHRTGASNCPRRPSNKNHLLPEKVFKSRSSTNIVFHASESTSNSQLESNDNSKNANNSNTTENEASTWIDNEDTTNIYIKKKWLNSQINSSDGSQQY